MHGVVQVTYMESCECSTEAKAVITDRATHKRHILYMYGDWGNSNMQLFLGKKSEGGSLLAKAGRDYGWHDFLSGHQEYVLSIEPGVDVALCVLMCITYDEFYNEH